MTKSKKPTHIAFIMDGNGRWAQSKSLPINAGHKAGAEVLRQIPQWCGDLGIKHITVYAFSTENWSRSRDEVDGIIKILNHYLKTELDEIVKNGIKLRVIGDYMNRVDGKIKTEIQKAEEKTKHNDRLYMNIAFSYGGRKEIIDAVKKIAKQVLENKINIDDLDEDSFRQFLYNQDMPDPDLIIRTGGACRISNFLLWQIAYSELYPIATFWPDFTKKDLEEAIMNFQTRDRRYGKRK